MAPDLPKTHRAAIFEKKGEKLTLKDVETPRPGKGEVLVKVLATGVCHSDMFVQGEVMGPTPRIPGHETIGDVVAIGEGESRWKVGDRVGAPWHGGHDGTCKQCQDGYYQTCDNAAVNGVTRDGGYQEYVLLRTEAVVSIPSNLDPVAYAPFLCAGVTVFNAIRNMNTPKGANVAIQGLGGLGHLAIQYADKMGYHVTALSTSENKEQFARDLGAKDFIHGKDLGAQLAKQGGAKLIVCTAPNPEVMQELQKGLAPIGKLLLLGPGGEIKIDSVSLVVKGQSVHGWPSGHAKDSEEAIAFAAENGIKCLVEEFPLEKANEAYEHMASGKARFRAVLKV